MESNLERERIFHNRTFTENTRAATDKFYAITQSSRRHYSEALLSCCCGRLALEFGCGPDGEAYTLAEQGAHVVGIDISEVAIQKAFEKGVRRGLVPHLDFRVMNAEALQFADNSFDIVFGAGILHHLDLKKTLSEIARVLKQDGRVIFIEPLGHNLVINWYRRLTPQMRTVDEHPLTYRDLNLIRNYFQSVKVVPFHLCSLIAVPFRHIKRFDQLVSICDAVDRALFKFPLMGKQAWQVVIEMSNPKALIV